MLFGDNFFYGISKIYFPLFITNSTVTNNKLQSKQYKIFYYHIPVMLIPVTYNPLRPTDSKFFLVLIVKSNV